ncbi:ABC transporter ATP-binding protein [Legionella sp. CNM-4043-24]|uniref:ABC transporter ATP-binding protein n=1 Tax=Legionella sp. CNM-4043-24 TaxID=3421646 RepID=UPI00403AE989
MTNKPLIQIDNLVKSYALEGVSTQVLKQVSLSIMAGELVAIVGASGSGKSTLMNVIGLLDSGDSGRYWLKQRDVSSLDQDDLARLRNQYIGFVFQQFHLLPRFNAVQNVALPLVYRRLPADEIEHRVMQALSRVGMAAFARHRPTQLSGGQQQRVAIARALVGEPDVILADEPTGALDSRTGADVLDLFLRLNDEGRTIIMVTHDEQVARQCKRRITLSDGQIVTGAGQ